MAVGPERHDDRHEPEAPPAVVARGAVEEEQHLQEQVRHHLGPDREPLLRDEDGPAAEHRRRHDVGVPADVDEHERDGRRVRERGDDHEEARPAELMEPVDDDVEEPLHVHQAWSVAVEDSGSSEGMRWCWTIQRPAARCHQVSVLSKRRSASTADMTTMRPGARRPRKLMTSRVQPDAGLAVKAHLLLPA